MSHPGAPLLQVQGLTKRFGGLVAVKDMTFDVRGGEIVGLIGPNGSGKSTVMKCVMGIERPTEGSVRIAGAEVAGSASHQIARQGVGIVFQHSRPLQRQTVLENITLALLPDSLLRLLADPKHEREARAIAERVGLTEVLDRRRRRRCRSPICASSNSPRRSRGIRRSCWWTNPSPDSPAPKRRVSPN